MKGHCVVLALAAACGGGHSSNPDAPGTGIDAPPDAPVRGPVAIHVRDSTGMLPAAPAPVVFVDTDTTMTTVMTDGQGDVSLSVFAGANATAVIATSDTTYELQTVFDVAPGDDITLGAAPVDVSSAGSFTVNFTADPGATSYSVVHPCGVTPSSSTATVVSMLMYCSHPTMDLVVVSLEANGQPLRYVEMPNVAFSDGGSVTMPATWQTLGAFSATYSNIGNDVTSMLLVREVPDADGFVLTGSGPPSGSPRTLQTNGPTAVTAELRTQLSATTGAYQIVTAEVDGTAETYALDVGANELGWIGKPTIDYTAEKITVPLTGSAAGDGFQLTLAYDDLMGDMWTWTLYAPGVQDIQLPAIPLEIGDLLPKNGYNIEALLGRLIETTALDGNAAFRAHPSDSFPHVGAYPASGTVIRVSTSAD